MSNKHPLTNRTFGKDGEGAKNYSEDYEIGPSMVNNSCIQNFSYVAETRGGVAQVPRVIVTQPDPETLLDSPKALFRSHPHLSVVKELLQLRSAPPPSFLPSFFLSVFPISLTECDEEGREIQGAERMGREIASISTNSRRGRRKGSCLKTEEPFHDTFPNLHFCSEKLAERWRTGPEVELER